MKGLMKVFVFTVISVFLASCVQTTKIEWNSKGNEYKGKIGTKATFTVDGGGSASSLWGTDIYTIDSSLATAAVHAGVITFEKGGTFTVEFLAGQTNYTASDRNGVSSGSWGPYEASFSIVK
ncbi:MAG: hypothetical protein HPY53_05400 [Brevinematales bacterium]|nr:hypothetical protein [Brevinematales bacterium]